MTARIASVSVCLLLLLSASVTAQPKEASWFDASNRFLDKDFPAPKLASSTTAIDSFEDWEATKKCWALDARFLRAEAVQEHATEGKFALKVTFQKPGHPNCNLRYVEGTSGWGPAEYERKAALSMNVIFNDEVRLDVFNPGAATTLTVEMGKPFAVALAPGKNEIALKISEMTADVFRITDILNATKIAPAQSDAEVVLYFDKASSGNKLPELNPHMRCFARYFAAIGVCVAC